jgi:hypothetical protein
LPELSLCCDRVIEPKKNHLTFPEGASYLLSALYSLLSKLAN